MALQAHCVLAARGALGELTHGLQGLPEDSHRAEQVVVLRSTECGVKPQRDSDGARRLRAFVGLTAKFWVAHLGTEINLPPRRLLWVTVDTAITLISPTLMCQWLPAATTNILSSAECN